MPSVDILVTASDSPQILLAIEVKIAVRDLAEAASPLKRYMVGMGVPAGLLVTANRIVIYRNYYLSESEDSVKQTKVIDLPKFDPRLSRYLTPPSETDNQKPAERALIFEENVQSWLEHLRLPESSHDLPSELKEAFGDYVLPVLNQGVIRAAHPREYSA